MSTFSSLHEPSPLAVQLLERYPVAWSDEVAWGGAAVALALVLGVTLTLLRKRQGPRWLLWVITALAVVFGLAWAFHLKWIGDDAYISFRYADNLAQGEGLVFNPGERVEGYTNFLWTVLIAGAIRAGADPALASIVLSLASAAATLFVATLLARRVSSGRPAVFFPFAAAALAANYTFASYGTSGLETMFGACLVLVAIERADRNAPLAAGLLGVLATMAHPDHAVFYAALGGALALDRERRLGLVRYAIPFFAVYLPYFIWRYSYYGDFFPNTYYAKSGNLTYFSQGGRYLLISFIATGVFGAVPLAAFGAFTHRASVLARFFFIAAPLYLVYVAKIGGDFMLGRLFVPLLPPLFVLAEVGAREAVARGRYVAATAGLCLFSLSAVPTRVVRPGEKYFHVADEREFYKVQSLFPTRIGSLYAGWADTLKRHFVDHGLRPTMAVGCIGIIGYETRLPLVDSFGLNDRHVAHRPITRRGRPGHEKLATPGYFVERDIDFSDFRTYPPEYDRFSRFRLGGIELYLAKYDRGLIEPLRARSRARVQSFERHLDTYDPSAVTDANTLACDLWFMERFYFAHNDDARRRRRIQERLVRADPSFSGMEDFILQEPDEASSAWTVESRLDFEQGLDGWSSEGGAFGAGPIQEAWPDQGVVFGASGSFIDSFGQHDGDAATGTLTSPPFEIVGDVMTVAVGGGNHAEIGVRLLLDDQPVFTATGCNTELLGRRVWNVASLRGKRVRLQIVDHTADGWGHVVVDSVRQWQRRLPSG